MDVGLTPLLSAELVAISSPQCQLWTDLRKANTTDPYLLGLHQKLLAHPEKHSHLLNREGVLLYKGRLVIPPSLPMLTALLTEVHDSKIGGFSIGLRIYSRLAQSFFWEAMKQDVQRFVAECEVCQRNKSKARSPSGLLQP